MLQRGYGLMPNQILFDDQLSPSAKLLFVYISSLCATEGYCWASNKHFAQRFGMSESQVSRLIGSLAPYIVITKGTNQHRKISMNEGVLPTQKAQGSLRKNAGHNITRGIKKNNKKKSAEAPATPTSAARTPEALGMPDLAGDFYDEYYAERRWR